jgi:hypothetical protein
VHKTDNSVMVHLSLSIAYLISRFQKRQIWKNNNDMPKQMGPLSRDLDVLLYTNANTKPYHQNKNYILASLSTLSVW